MTSNQTKLNIDQWNWQFMMSWDLSRPWIPSDDEFIAIAMRKRLLLLYGNRKSEKCANCVEVYLNDGANDLAVAWRIYENELIVNYGINSSVLNADSFRSVRRFFLSVTFNFSTDWNVNINEANLFLRARVCLMFDFKLEFCFAFPLLLAYQNI